MHLDMTVTFGDVLHIAAIAVAVFAGYWKLRVRLVRIETRLQPLWKEFTERRTFHRRHGDRE